jgi:hypothetical protein
MSNVGRILLKDVRRFWPLAVGADLLAFFLAFFPALGLTGANSSVISAAESVRLIVIGLAVVALMQEDLVVSDHAAWITRPITATGVLAAKLLALVVLFILPFWVITAAGAHRYDLGLATCLAVGGGHSAKLLVIAIFFALVGVLTPSFLMAVFVFAGSAVALMVLQPYVSLFGSPNGGEVSLDSYRPSTLIVAAALLILALGYHYRQRQWRRSLVAVAAALVLAILAMHLIETTPPAKGAIPGLKVTAVPSRGFVGATLARPFPFSDQVVVGLQLHFSRPTDGDYYVDPVAASFSARDGRAFAQELPNGAWIQSFGELFSGIYSSWNSYPQAAHTVLDIALKDRTATAVRAVVALSGRDFEGFRGATGVLHVALTGDRQVVTDRGFVPLEVGATMFLRGARLKIEAVRFASAGNLEVKYRRTNVESRSVSSERPLFALINDQAGEVSLEENGRDFGGQAESYLLYDYQEPILFSHRWSRHSDQISEGISPDWLKSARLAYFIIAAPDGTRAVEMVVPDFAMPAIGGSQ